MNAAIEKIEDFKPEAPPAPGPRFRLVPFGKIELDRTAPYLVRDLIPREGLTVIWGPPKCGKTFVTSDLAIRISLGWEYRGRPVERGTVVYVACEGERGLGQRIAAFKREYMGDETEDPPFHLLTTRLDLARDAEELITDIRSQAGAKLAAIVIDTLNRSIGGSESSDEDMGAYVKGSDAIRTAFSCAVIIIHHCGINDKRPRGHTALTGAADAQIAVTKDKITGLITAKVEFMKDGPEGDEITSSLKVIDLGQDERGRPITSCAVIEAQGEAKRAKPFSPKAKQALDLLREAILDAGKPAPTSPHIPEGVMGVTKTTWRAYCEKGGIINAEGNPREEFRRLIVTLKDAGAVGVWDDFSWPVT